MKKMSKKLDKGLSKIFFNSVEEMNECYGVDTELPIGLHSNVDLVCYEIVEHFTYNYVAQYKFTKTGFYQLNNLGEHVICGRNAFRSEFEVYEYDVFKHEGRCFAYVRVNEHLRKHLEKSLLGCEFVHFTYKAEVPVRRFVHNVEVGKLGIVVTDKYGFTGYLSNMLFYPDDHSDPIYYKEWVKKINEQDVEG